MALPTSTNYGQSVTKFAVVETTKDWGSIADGDEADVFQSTKDTTS